MSELVRLPTAQVPESEPELAPLSETLRQAAYIARTGAPVSPEVQAEARRLLDGMAFLLAPPSEALVTAWIGPLAVAVLNAPGGRNFAAYVMMLAAACETVPAAALNAATRVAAARRFKFWPSVAEVVELLEERAWRLIDRRRELLSILDVQAADAPVPAAPAEVAELAEKLRGLATEIAARGPPPDDGPAPRRASHLSPEQLRAIRAGGSA